MRIKGLIETIADFDDALWRQEAAFFVGEFLLALMPMEAGGDEEWRNHPSAGSFLYYSNARYAITRFLKKNVRATEAMDARPLREILAAFDGTAKQVQRFVRRWRPEFSPSYMPRNDLQASVRVPPSQRICDVPP